MSLLMDALKKAEQEKRDAAKRQQESQEGLTSASDTKEPKNLDDTWEHEIVESAPASSGLSSDSTMRSTTAELALEPIQEQETEGGDTTSEISASEAESEDPTLNVTMNKIALAEMSTESMDLKEQASEATEQADITDLQGEDSAALLDETFHGVALEGDVENSELFQETMQGEAYIPGEDSYEETLPGVPAAQLAKDIGGGDDQPTPVAAQTVFAATGTVQESSFGFKWILAGLCIVAMIAGSVWYFITVTPVNRRLPSPLVAQGVESIIPPVLETEALLEQPMVGTLSGEPQTIAEESAQVGVSEVVETDSTDAEEVVSVTGMESAPEGARPEEAETMDASPEKIEVDKTPEPVISGPQEDDSLAGAGLPKSIMPEPSLIKISRSKSIESKGQLVNEAYAAYQAADYETALAGYQEVLKNFPDNNDALLGLGAIAMNNGDYEDALGIYSHLLRIDPRNEIAKTVLISLQDKSAAVNSESVIKSMIHENPDKPFLHFSLGNIHASEFRWAEAQQAFFNAYTRDTSNPDYALNLAISLDHMGQKDTALDYYHVAMKLADEKPASFDVTPVMTRIQSLNNVVKRP
jgi:Flp pilus assembly protein TadD